MTVYTEIKNLIGKGKLEKALEVSLRLNDLDKQANNQLFILSGQYCKWKVNDRIGIVDDSNLNKIRLGLLELIGEIESSKSDSSSADEKESTQQESEQIGEDDRSEIEAINMDKIDFNVSEDESVEVIFHSKYWKIKHKILVPKKLTLHELIDALITHYDFEEVLVPPGSHKVEWIFLVNHQKITDRNGRMRHTLEKRGLKNGDNISIKTVFTKYNIKMKGDKPEIEKKRGVIPCAA